MAETRAETFKDEATAAEFSRLFPTGSKILHTTLRIAGTTRDRAGTTFTFDRKPSVRELMILAAMVRKADQGIL